MSSQSQFPIIPTSSKAKAKANSQIAQASSSRATVWDYFKKIDSKSVSCNMCGNNYKSSGNTTNLYTHLKNKHFFIYVRLKGKSLKNKTGTIISRKRTEMQMQDGLDHDMPASTLRVNKNEDTESIRMIVNEDEDQRDTDTDNDIPNVDEDQQSQISVTSDQAFDISFRSPTLALPAGQQCSLGNFFEHCSSLEEGGQRHTTITQALIFMICKDNMPFSCEEKEGLQKFCRVACPRYKLPSRYKVTQLIEQKYIAMRAILQKVFEGATFVALTSDILTLTNSTRSFIVMTAHFHTDGAIESLNLSARKMFQSHTAANIRQHFEDITTEFGIQNHKIISITTDGGANIVAAASLFLGDGKRIPCMAHLINLVVDGALKESRAFSKLCDHIKSIVQYFKQSVNAMDNLRKEQEASGRKEGEVITLIQSVSTRWNSCFDMLSRFIQLSGIVANVLDPRSATKRNVPDMVVTSQLNVIRDCINLLKGFKQATEDISGKNYVTASLVIPLANLLREELEQARPITDIGICIKNKLLNGVLERLIPLEKNPFLAKATILDPRFKKIYFSSPLAVSNAVQDISGDIRMEHRRRGQVSPESPEASNNELSSIVTNKIDSIWTRHEKMVAQASANQEVPSAGAVPNELKQYLDQKNIDRSFDPVQYWFNCKNFTPVLAETALKYLLPQGSSVSSERVASTVNLVVPNNRSRLTGEHVNQRVFLCTIPSKYWNL